MDDNFFDRVNPSNPSVSPVVERPVNEYGKCTYVSARDFIDNAPWGPGVRHTFFCQDTQRDVSFELKEGPYQGYVVITWKSEGEGVERTEDVYIIAELWDGWEEKFDCKPYRVQIASDVRPCFLSQMNLTTLDIEAYFGLCYCTRT